MRIPKLRKFRFRKTIKVKIDRDVCNLILKRNRYISKKDIGAFISELLLKQDDLDSSICNYVSKKYSLKKITTFLKNSDKNDISFRKIREMLDLSKRKFYPRLRIIKIYFMNRHDFNWTIKRGKFVRLS